MKTNKYSFCLMPMITLALLPVKSSFAGDVEVIGSIKQNIKQSTAPSAKIKSDKIIQLLHVQLSEEEKKRLTLRAEKLLAPKNQALLPTVNANGLPAKQLGMNRVPVLDQGMHGTCVTFAVTGALDAILGKGDYISQVCNLQLGSYLEKHSYSLSGWDGSQPITVINQIEQYGVVNNDKQRAYGCGGLKEYPIYSPYDNQSFIEPEQFRSMSELVFGKSVNWTNIYHEDDPDQTLNEVKNALQANDRLVFAVLLPRTDLGAVGAVGKYNTWVARDSWVLIPEIAREANNTRAAHEMIITGYNDNAEAVDYNGMKHKGLLTLRNSWGDGVGDYGEFYMSYDYFKLLAYDVKRLTKI
jgi:hypothetical protein